MAIKASIVTELNPRGIREAESEFKKLAKTVGSIFAGQQVVRFAKSAVDAASNLAEVQSKSNVVFGESVAAVEKFAASAARAYGQSERAALEAASTFGVFGKAAGLTGDSLASFSTDLAALASDMASFSNTTTDEAIMALGAALRGESEPIRRYGVMLDDATLKAKAFELGIYSGTGTLTMQQKVLAANASIFEQTADAQGDFARTSEGVANQQRILNAELENAKAVAGDALVPAYRDLLQVAGGLLKTFDGLPQPVKAFAIQAGIAASTAGAAGAAMKSMGINAGVAAKTAGVLAGVMFVMAARAAENAENILEVENALNQLNRVADDQVLRQFDAALTAGAISGQSFYDSARKITDQSPETARRILDIANAAGINDAKIQALRYAYTDTNTEIQRAARVSKEYNDELDSSLPTIDQFTSKQNEQEQAALDAANALEEQFNQLRDLVSLQLTAISSELGYKDQVDQTKDALDEYNKLQTEIIDGKYEGTNAARELASAERAVYNEAIGNAEAAVRWAEEQANLNGESLSAAEIHQIQVDELRKVADTLAPNSPLRKQLQAYITQLTTGLPKKVTTQIQAFYDAELRFKSVIRPGEVEARAAGGPVDARTPYLVGEVGPELFVPSTSGTVIPNDELMRSTVSGSYAAGGAVNLYVTVTNPVASGEQLANELAAYTRRNGTRWLAGVV